MTQPTFIQNRTATKQFDFHHRPEPVLSLQVNEFDNKNPMTADQSKAFVNSSFRAIDVAWMDERTADTNLDDAVAGGKAHANAEIIAFTLSDNEHDYNYEAQGERILNDRREGVILELDTPSNRFEGPGDLSGVKRQMMVDHFRTRADESFVTADRSELPTDVAAYFFSQSEVFSETARELSGEDTF